MTTFATARLLLRGARLVGVAGAALVVVLMAWWGQEVYGHLFFSENPNPGTWGEVGAIPFLIPLRAVVAAWVAWSAIRPDERSLARNLLIAFGVSFFLLHGWYLLLAAMDFGPLSLAAGGDLLYLAAGLMALRARRLSAADTRLGNDGP